jgi:hypothetical protein
MVQMSRFMVTNENKPQYTEMQQIANEIKDYSMRSYFLRRLQEDESAGKEISLE